MLSYACWGAFYSNASKANVNVSYTVLGYRGIRDMIDLQEVQDDSLVKKWHFGCRWGYKEMRVRA